MACGSVNDHAMNPYYDILSNFLSTNVVVSIRTMVPQTVAKIAICNCPMASGDNLVVLIAKLAKVGGV